MSRSAFISRLILLAVFASRVAGAAEENVPGYANSVRPILARNCFPCHGPDADSREADLRLDVRDAASNAGALEPDEPSESLLLERIRDTDPDTMMPPADSGKSLKAEEVQTLVRWVEGGAKYETHWSFVPPSRPPVPTFDSQAPAKWRQNAIDAFLLKAMEKQRLQPSSEANRYTLVRRVYLDLIGLLPTPEEADAFVSDTSDDAWLRLVNKLLKSPHYGERWARPWLDLARYSDTNGYEKDRPRSIWPYRDWVINALNRDMPFDQFTIEQLAGDMLPEATIQQRVATGFHRNTMLNEEGGIDPLEYRFHAMVDRVATTGTVWMGLTIGCAQCHSHKYDPISHTDYYRFMALLNNADEPDLALPAQDENETRELTSKIKKLETNLPNKFPGGRTAFDMALKKWIEESQQWVAHWLVAEPIAFRSNLPKLARLEDDSLFASGDFTKRDEYAITLRLPTKDPITAIRLEALPDERLPERGPGRAYYEGRKGDFFLSELEFEAGGKPVAIGSGSRSFGKIAVGSGNAEADNVFDGDGSTGWSTATREGERHTLVVKLAEPLAANELGVSMLFERHFVAALGRFRFSVTTDEGEVRAIDVSESVESVLLKKLGNWSDADQKTAATAFALATPELEEARKAIEKPRQKLNSKTQTLVMEERPADNPRATWRHHRGEWLGKREKVAGGVPEIFSPLPSGAPADRLTLARWLVSKKNPLVARVVVNRAWQQFMGDGLVRSDGDFGTQSTPPTNAELLDWLACEFVDSGWSMKGLHRKIVMSAAYRQSSVITPELLAADPENMLHARGPRHRVDAEMVRDILLCGSGLLSKKSGGPSVFPPQPKIVTERAYGSTKWNTSKGPDRYRRSLYTYNKRTAPFAAFTTFDGPTGENCVVKRNRSNTPLQSLTLLNDEMFLELARALGKRAGERKENTEARIAFMFRSLLIRLPDESEIARLVDYHDAQLKRLVEGELTAAEIMNEASANEVAALAMVARVLVNLDEVITKQ